MAVLAGVFYTVSQISTCRVQSAVEGIRLGIDDYIVKPTNANSLLRLLADKLAQRAANKHDPS